MRKIILTAALLAAVPAAVQAKEPVRFQYAGVDYEYVVTPQADGSNLITGRNLDNNQAFKLTVRGRQVYGTVGHTSVEFSAPRSASGAKLASK